MKILIAGDFCPQNRVAELFDKGEYETVLDDVKQTISSADYSVVNFECPVADNDKDAIKKQGPSLRCSEKGVEAVKRVGFDCVTLANNHFLDQGANGVEKTLLVCKRKGIDTVGGGRNLKEAANILYKEIDGKKLAIINCCEHEFSIATEKTAGSNPINSIQQYYDIREARTNADFVLIIVHGGHEMWQIPSPRMKELYRFFIDAGADSVVNHHQHCFSGYEIYKGKPIFYGLGNFCFDRPKRQNCIWNEGYMVQLEFTYGKDVKVNFGLIPYKQCSKTPDIRIMKGDDIDVFRKKIERLNSIIADDNAMNAEFNKLVGSNESAFMAVLSPFNSRILRGLVRRKLIPCFVSRKKILLFYNRIVCESHRDIMISMIRNKITS